MFGWLLGNARTSWELQGPAMQVPFVTSKVMPLRGSTDDEQAANKKSDAEATKCATGGIAIAQRACTIVPPERASRWTLGPAPPMSRLRAERQSLVTPPSNGLPISCGDFLAWTLSNVPET